MATHSIICIGFKRKRQITVQFCTYCRKKSDTMSFLTIILPQILNCRNTYIQLLCNFLRAILLCPVFVALLFFLVRVKCLRLNPDIFKNRQLYTEWKLWIKQTTTFFKSQQGMITGVVLYHSIYKVFQEEW